MKIPQIQSTSDYKKLNHNPLQRTFSAQKVNQLAVKMTKNGFPPSMAISVYKDDGELFVNTGHHRLAAARQVGIPVLYVVEKKWTPKQLVDEGVTSKPWSSLSASQCFASEGNEDYMLLLDYADKGIPLNMAASMLWGESAGSGNTAKKIINGDFKVRSTLQADTFVNLFVDFAEDMPAVKSRSFIAALSKCLFIDEFDLSTLKRRMSDNPSMLRKTSDTDQMLRLIEEIYNYRSSKKIPLAFMAANASTERGRIGK